MLLDYDPTPEFTSLRAFLAGVGHEVLRAQSKYSPFNSAHEAYAVLLEEVDELWEQVKVKQGKRDPRALLEELTQVAAMAARFAIDLHEVDYQK